MYSYAVTTEAASAIYASMMSLRVAAVCCTIAVILMLYKDLQMQDKMELLAQNAVIEETNQIFEHERTHPEEANLAAGH